MPMKTGYEYDALTKGKRYYNWRPGARAYIKRHYRRKERRWLNRQLIEKDYEDDWSDHMLDFFWSTDNQYFLYD